MKTLTIKAADAVSIASLINGASKDKWTPILTAIHVRIIDGTVTAISTDRYTAARYDTTGDGPDGELMITADIAKFITANVKAGKSRYAEPEPVELTYSNETREISARHGLAVIGDTWPASSTPNRPGTGFPDVASIMDTWTADTTPRAVTLKSEFLARLNKFLDSFKKTDLWLLELGANPNGNATKPGPVMARSGKFSVLIQPNLINPTN
jgi:hypothetical protein